VRRTKAIEIKQVLINNGNRDDQQTDKYIYTINIFYIEKQENIFVITRPYHNFFTLLFCGLDFLLALRHVPYLPNVNPALTLGIED